MTDDTTTDGATEGQADDDPATAGAEPTAADGTLPAEAERSPDDADPSAGDADVRDYLLKAALVMLVALGVVATLQFYLSAQTAIRRFASDEFRPVFVAAFNLVVLLAVGVGVAQVVRRLG